MPALRLIKLGGCALRTRWRGILLAACLSTAGTASALAPGERVDDFRLLDHDGASHALSALAHKRAVVIVTQANGCPLVRKVVPALRALRTRFGPRQVEFLLLNVARHDDRDAIAAEARSFGFDLPVLVDDTRLIAESLGVTRTAEAFVIDPRDWTLRYRGPVDDRLSYGAEKPGAAHDYLRDALESVLADRPVAEKRVEARGCLVEASGAERKVPSPRTYADQVAPILRSRCVGCHQRGGVAPWAMDGYERVLGFAPMIREVVRTKRMPPWDADPHYGRFKGDRSLSAAQARTLVHWIEAGAPRGEGDDPLRTTRPEPSAWRLGKPDLILDVPPFEVPATGVVEYQYPRLPNPLGRDVWVRAIETHPGDRSVVHHLTTFADDPKLPGGYGRQGNVHLGGFAPGMSPIELPKDTAVFVPKDATFVVQVHYTPSGRAVIDRSQVGLYVSEKPPRYVVTTEPLAKFSFAIPPGEPAHTEVVTRRFEREVVLYSVMPHAHLRGKSGRLTAQFPDGRSETLLHVPRFDFNWQTSYAFGEPVTLPRGASLTWAFTWDNSPQNPANPDPTRAVYWGDQTWEEMGIAWLRYRYRDESAADFLRRRDD